MVILHVLTVMVWGAAVQAIVANVAALDDVLLVMVKADITNKLNISI